MTRTLFAAMSGVAFGLVLGVSGYHFHAHRCGQASAPPQIVRIEQAPSTVAVISYVTVASTTVEEEIPPTPAEIDAQADLSLAQARALAKKEPARARALCRKAMQLYHNNPKNGRVRTAFKLLNTIKIPDDDDDIVPLF